MKISVITPSYNSQSTIINTIESLINQSFKDVEHIIVDNISNDDTLKVIENYRHLYNENGIELKILCEKDNGLYNAINKGIMISSGQIIGILSSNDRYNINDALKIIHDEFEKNNLDAVYGNVVFTKNDTITRNWKSKEFKSGDFYKSWTPAHPTFYYNKKLHNVCGMYRTDYKISSDVDFMFKALEIKKSKSKFIDKIFIEMSDGGLSNDGIKSKLLITKEMFNTFQEHKIKVSKFKYLLYKIIKIKERIFKK
jgi:glycosyltransferase involved in cell wall biosynthesis